MGFLMNWLLKDTKDQVALDHAKLKGFFVSQNGLYRNKDGSIPELADFTKYGFTEDQYFLAVHGATQAEMQNRLMAKNALKRSNRRNVMNKRLIKNTQRVSQAAKNSGKRKFRRFINVNDFAFFAPFGLYGVGQRDGQFFNLIELSNQITGTPLGLFDMMMNQGIYDHSLPENPLNDLYDQLNTDYLNTNIHNAYDPVHDYGTTGVGGMDNHPF